MAVLRLKDCWAGPYAGADLRVGWSLQYSAMMMYRLVVEIMPPVLFLPEITQLMHAEPLGGLVFMGSSVEPW